MYVCMYVLFIDCPSLPVGMAMQRSTINTGPHPCLLAFLSFLPFSSQAVPRSGLPHHIRYSELTYKVHGSVLRLELS